MRLLHWPGREAYIVQLVEFPFKRKALLGPRSANHLKSLFSQCLTVVTRYPESGKLFHAIAFANTQIQTSIGKNIYRGRVFGDSERVLKRQDENKSADANTTGASGDTCG